MRNTFREQNVNIFQALLPYLAWVSLPCITRLHKTRLRRAITVSALQLSSPAAVGPPSFDTPSCHERAHAHGILDEDIDDLVEHDTGFVDMQPL